MRFQFRHDVLRRRPSVQPIDLTVFEDTASYTQCWAITNALGVISQHLRSATDVAACGEYCPVRESRSARSPRRAAGRMGKYDDRAKVREYTAQTDLPQRAGTASVRF